MPERSFWCHTFACSLVGSFYGFCVVLVAVVVLLFLDIFIADARNAVVVSVFFVTDACCGTLGDGAIVLPLTFCVSKLAVDAFKIVL